MNNNEKTFIDKMLYGPRLILVTGHFGSGKTEFSVSLGMFLATLLREPERNGTIGSSDKSTAALLAAEAFKPYTEAKPKELYVAIADLDVENPYFRSREQRELLNANGVKTYSDAYGGKNESELQTVDAAVLAPIEDPKARLIIDTGGNDTGAMILNQFSRHFHDNYQMLQVINCNRPGNDTVEKALEQIKATEKITGLKVSGLVSNAHFVTYTTKEDVLEGFKFTRKVSDESGLPIVCVCAKPDIYKELIREQSQEDAEAVYFPIGMYMRASYLDKGI